MSYQCINNRDIPKNYVFFISDNFKALVIANVDIPATLINHAGYVYLLDILHCCTMTRITYSYIFK